MTAPRGDLQTIRKGHVMVAPGDTVATWCGEGSPGHDGPCRDERLRSAERAASNPHITPPTGPDDYLFAGLPAKDRQAAYDRWMRECTGAHPADHLHDVVEDTPRYSDAAPTMGPVAPPGCAVPECTRFASRFGLVSVAGVLRPACDDHASRHDIRIALRDLRTAPNVLHTVEARLATAGITVHDEDMALAGVRALMRLIGDDPTRTGVEDTPARFVRAYRELCARPGDPATLLGRTFPLDEDDASDEAISVGPIPFTSVCEHHLLPFTGTAWVAYIPDPDTRRIVGLSKIPRLVHHYAGQPQVQERLTAQVARAMRDHLAPRGVAVQVRATHTCMSLRGVKVDGATMVTTRLLGAFREDPAARAEFLALTR